MFTREKIVGLIVGTIGALMLAAGTASLANFGARGVNILFIILGLVWFAFGVRAVQKKARPYFFTLRGLTVFGFVVCTCFFGYFLFRGESWPYGSISTNVGTTSYYDVSAYRYFFAWSGAERDSENKMEAATGQVMQNLVDMNGNPIGGQASGSLSDKVGFNILFAILGALGALSFASLPLLRRFMSKTEPNTALEPDDHGA